ncbi:hypothetical protein ANCCEY_04265 [Ancylostoma ceylanicum]|uniref:Uncharacterized protein n=2 Tax=Ancylostoma ceylanicum TaxID=53326 RepID=A0A8I3B0Z6_9BILA|nr:hypothetical protein ANCCEY_04265 [Ancylostoma ceylanicum]EYB93640.1 hypothetical protein Y032_0180g803 [Ancylostoma ceylanicum]
MDQRSSALSGVLSSSLHSAYFVLLLNVFIALLSAVNCKKKEDAKRKEGGSSAKPITPKGEAEKRSRKSNPETTPKKGEKQEDTFEEHKPKKEEAKRAKDIKDAKAFNAGDYKTWNKLMKEDDDFEKPLADKGAGGADKGAGGADKEAEAETAKGPPAEPATKPTKSSREKGGDTAARSEQAGPNGKENKEQNKEAEEKDTKKKEDS